MNVPTVLTIAASDSSAGAGIQLDLKVFERIGVYGLSAVTAITAQDTRGVHKIARVAPRIVAAQIDAVMRDIGANACKVGMLYNATVVDVVAERIRRRRIPNVVLDPVILAKDNTVLLLDKAVQRMKRSLIPKCLLVTPNVREAEILSGKVIRNTQDMREAALSIHELGCQHVLIKGGHLAEDPVDILFNGWETIELPGSRIHGPPVHGTGCAFSAALASRLAMGDEVLEAARFAKDFTADLIRKAIRLGKGSLLIFTSISAEVAQD